MSKFIDGAKLENVNIFDGGWTAIRGVTDLSKATYDRPSNCLDEDSGQGIK